MLSLSQVDQQELQQRGLSPLQVEEQVIRLRQGTSPLQLVRPCRLGDGILDFSPQQIAEYHKRFHFAQAAGRVSKFIPASGAATRMFKDLLQFLEGASSSRTPQADNQPLPKSIMTAWEHLLRFPFVANLQQELKSAGKNFSDLYQGDQRTTVFRALLHVPGLGYAHLPKALLPFHRYPDGTRTALEEHVQEARIYAQQAGPIRIHLTVSAQFQTQVEAHLESIRHNVFKNCREVDLTVSIQKPSTDTVALDAEGQPFRDNEGRLVFRPGGHGALLENLNDFQGDIVCISNIDNVVPDGHKEEIVNWRMALIGYLLTEQHEIFHHRQQLEWNPSTALQEAEAYLREHLQQPIPSSYDDLDRTGKVDWLTGFLHRPIRVCGMVPNTGDPGGGPFWVQHADGSQSRQIVEQSQGDPESESQQRLFASATHFNPVDMVCGVRDFQGQPFNLLTFRDPTTSFISQKTYLGRPLRALEWPGLWNGGMADWITLFVEVPRTTFNPVKTFLDWLHPHHQPLD